MGLWLLKLVTGPQSPHNYLAINVYQLIKSPNKHSPHHFRSTLWLLLGTNYLSFCSLCFSSHPKFKPEKGKLFSLFSHFKTIYNVKDALHKDPFHTINTFSFVFTHLFLTSSEEHESQSHHNKERKICIRKRKAKC